VDRLGSIGRDVPSIARQGDSVRHCAPKNSFCPKFWTVSVSLIKQKGNSANIPVTGRPAPTSNSTSRNETTEDTNADRAWCRNNGPSAPHQAWLAAGGDSKLQVTGKYPSPQAPGSPRPALDRALPSSLVLLVNSPGGSPPACRNINALGIISQSQIVSKTAYIWPT
jgi:hypothetical protein